MKVEKPRITGVVCVLRPLQARIRSYSSHYRRYTLIALYTVVSTEDAPALVTLSRSDSQEPQRGTNSTTTDQYSEVYHFIKSKETSPIEHQSHQQSAPSSTRTTTDHA